MATIAFDTLKYSKRLKDAGVPDNQAEAEAEALKEVLADFAADKLQGNATSRDLKDLETAFKRDLTETETRLKHEIELMRMEARDLERRMTIKLGGLMVIAVGAVATLVKLL
jgi:hypothetical protein